MAELNPRTYFFRPSRSGDAEPVLNPALVAVNAFRGIETTLALDTNVLIAMERVVKEGNKNSLLKKYGLHNLVGLLDRCPPKSICLSPGMAFDEMPPALAEKSRWNYEAFCSKHLPSFTDTPNCIHKTFVGKDSNYGYLDLEPVAQAFLAIPFVALLYLNIVDKHFSGSPIQKFKECLRRLSDDLDMLSAKEIEIAKYCFAEPPAAATETIRLRKLLRANFLKTKDNKAVYTYDEAMAVAFNGACDLTLINFANVAQTKGLDGVQQDCRIATRDKKLFEFSKISHYLDLGGEAGKFAVATILPENANDGYWQEAADAQQSLGLSRMPRHLTREIDVLSYPAIARVAIDEVARVFQNA
ncbi:hypothetical protein [Acidithiobacillus sp. AMEEHan]|uniref:hypothetical protein n=1 Tax=Acidithiobacillus sp. AMEEHan TaxID=2994951 RepID=UPI0027E4550E|nr:hypothetical protein [Acidithiobacillus sp. AMEEHan]